MFSWWRRRRSTSRQMDPELVAEACAQICEARAASLLKASNYPDQRIRVSEGLEAQKCAAAVRDGWREFYRAIG